MTPLPEVRPSPIAGTWYNAYADKLRASIHAYLNQGKRPEIQGEVVGLIVPHAGHIYSGKTAGQAYQMVLGMSFELVTILSPLHQYHFSTLSTSAHAAYETPLGTVKVDHQAIDLISEVLKISSQEVVPIAFDQEHSIEIQLPFLQCALKERFLLLPIMVRTNDAVVLQALGEAIGDAMQGRRGLVVASTDLSHFHTLDQAKELDTALLRQIEHFSPQGVLEAERTGCGEACGAGAVAACLWAAQAMGASSVKLLHYSTSADQTGDTSSVVGYGAGVILK